MNRYHQSTRLRAGHLIAPALLVFVAVLLVISAGSGFGAETPAAKDSPTTKVSPASTKAAVPAKDANAESPRDQSQKKLPDTTSPADTDRPPKRNTDLDRQLLRDLLPDLSLPTGSPTADSKRDGKEKAKPRSRVPLADELDEAVEAMREVSRRLDTRNLSDETADLQSGIVSNIDALIEKLQNLQPPSSSPSSDPSDQDQSEQDPQQDSKTGSKQQPDKTRQTQPGVDSASRPASQPKTGKSGESTEQNNRQARERAAALARRRALIDEVWGHLPPVMRERLLNVGGEKLLPKYEDMIRRYYESLAEPVRAGSRRSAKPGF